MEVLEAQSLNTVQTKGKSKLVAIILWIFLGQISAHNIYLGKIKKGLCLAIFYVVSCIIFKKLGNESVSDFVFFDFIITPIKVMVSRNFLAGLFGVTCSLGILTNMIFELVEIVRGKYRDDNNQNVFSPLNNIKKEPKKIKAFILWVLGIVTSTFIYDLYLGRIKRFSVLFGIAYITLRGNIFFFFGTKEYTEYFLDFSINSPLFVFLVIVVGQVLYSIYELINIATGKIKDDDGNYVFLTSVQLKIKDKMEYIRSDVKIIDSKILFLLKERMEKVEQIGKLKKVLKLDIYDPIQEEKVKTTYKEHAKSLSLDESFTEKICQNILEESKKIQLKETCMCEGSSTTKEV